MAFQVLEAAHQMVRELRPVVQAMARMDKPLADQLRRAASSVPLNIAEGNGRAGNDRLHHFRIAAGSAREVRAALHVAEGWGHIEAAATAPALTEVDRILAMLWRLSH
jgi:four helix bundle protein